MNQNKYPSNPVLLVDDEVELLESLELPLIQTGINNIIHCTDGRKVMHLVSTQKIEVIVLDILMPNITGEEILDQVTSGFPSIPVIMLTAVDELNTAVKCMQLGAFDYMVKPIENSRFVNCLKRAIELRELRWENYSLRKNLFTENLKHPDAFKEIVSNDSVMRSIFQYIEMIAKNQRHVLITGETGTGKELIARALHKLSGHKGEFVAVNVGGLDDNMFSDTLFGHVKGGFTGAEQHRPGLIERASQGTLFLDEIGDLSAASQVKLLRLLQDAEYYPLGSDVQKLTDARIIVATNSDIDSLAKKSEFRKDLYYRLSAHHIELPPLRQRLDDLPILLDHLLEKAALSFGKKKPTPPPELLTLLATYDFPGNVRELENMVFDAISRHNKGKLSMQSFKTILDKKGESTKQEYSLFSSEAKPENTQNLSNLFGNQFPTIKKVEQMLIKEALDRSKGNQSIAARMLGLSRSTLCKRLKQT